MDKLLSLLNSNARMSSEDMAAMLGKSKDEIEKEIKEYEDKGIIKGYKAVIDKEEIGREYVEAIIEIKVSPKKDQGFEEIAQKIAKFSEVENVFLMSGGFDLAIIVSGKTLKDVAMFVSKRLSPLDSVLSTATHFVLKRYKDSGIMFEKEEVDERRVNFFD